MKKLHCLLFFFLFALTAIGQRSDRVDPVKDRRQLGEYTIELTPAPGNTFLYRISKNMVMLPAPPLNPVTSLPEGFEKKDDAFKVATWMIQEHRKTGRLASFLPPHVAQELNVPLNIPARKPNN